MRRVCTMAWVITALGGCGDEFAPRSLLDGYRVLGIAAEPPEVGVDGQVRLTLHDFDADGATYHPVEISGLRGRYTPCVRIPDRTARGGRRERRLAARHHPPGLH